MKKTILTIVLATLCLIFNATSQRETLKISGTILDENGLPIPNASITIQGLKNHTTSNEKGQFQLEDIPAESTLIISSIGFKSQTLQAKLSRNVGKIILFTDNTQLQEVEINAGYYTVKDKERTGSISRVTAETISKQPVSNPLAALIGRMAGVNIEQQSGVAGSGFKVEIRGRNSLRNDALDPLYLIDGVPFPSAHLTSNDLSVISIGSGNGASPLNYINPADIESIEVLKDADATAIYGSRGANGVILIKTKSAKAGKTAFDLNISTGLSTASSKLNLLNTSQYLEMRNEAFANDKATPQLTDYDLNGSWSKDKYTDWQKELIGNTAQNTMIQTGISGGNDLTQFAFRTGYSKQTTVFPGDFADQKGSGALTLNHKSVNEKFKINFSATYAADRNHLPQFDLTQYILLPPSAPALYDAQGKLNWALGEYGDATWDNPLAATKSNYNGNTNSFISSGYLSYQFIPALWLKSNFGYSNIRLTETLQNPLSSQKPSAYARGSSYITNNTIETWIMEPQISYKRTIGLGKLDVLLGSTFQKDNQNKTNLFGYGYTDDLLLESIDAAPAKGGSSSSNQYKYSALFGRINYSHQEKYFINLTGRRDGSSRFGPQRQFANFGALGLAWIFTNEPFVNRLLPLFSFGKFRASYGITGSDQIDNYGYLATYTASQPYLDGSGLIPTRIANPDFGWESNKKLEAAMDLGFYQDKIIFSAAWYRNRSANQLVGYALADIAGFPTVQYNLPATVQNTGWEFELNTFNVSTKSFSWKSAFNLTLPQNKLLSYPDIEGSSYYQRYTIGQSLYTPYALHYLGVNPKTGLYEYQNLNHNGNDTDQADKRTANKPLTTYLFGGLQNSFTFKSLQLDLFFQFVGKTAYDPIVFYGTPGTSSNQQVDVMKRWRTEGDRTKIQKFSQSYETGGASEKFYAAYDSDHFADASFIRLKNVSLSLNLPPRWIDQLKLRAAKLYLQGQNLWLTTKYKGDPEILNVRILPALRTITMGFQINL